MIANYIKKNNIISPKQFEFYYEKSTKDVIVALIKRIYTSLDAAVFIDLTKAFVSLITQIWY